MARSVEDHRDYLRLVAGILWQPCLNRQLDQSDVVQETLQRAVEKLDQFHGGDSEVKLRAWLRAILTNLIWERVRGCRPADTSFNESSRSLEELLAADDSWPSERVLCIEMFDQLADALGTLLEDERTAVELKYVHGCSVRFISQHMGRTGPAVGGLLKRGMRKLREALQVTAYEDKV
jgi:RNA polymerase sigma-70 factor (subfamily 1)